MPPSPNEDGTPQRPVDHVTGITQPDPNPMGANSSEPSPTYMGQHLARPNIQSTRLSCRLDMKNYIGRR